MNVSVLPPEPRATLPASRLKRFTKAEYNRLVESGVYTTEDRFELLEGWLVDKMPNNPPHATSLGLLEDLLIALLLSPWIFRTQRPISLSGDSVPEPDLVVVKGPRRRFAKRHPTAAEIALLVEVSDSTLLQDRGIKLEMYAVDRIQEYWIINLVDNVVEVYTQPKGGRNPSYRQTISYCAGESVPLRIDGKHLGEVAVSDLLP
jgi:Uma2 family endonuclease